jgi:hypothetical protein
MADSNLNIRITAQDKASASINNVSKSMAGLGKEVSSIQGAVQAFSTGGLPGLGRAFSSLSGIITGSAGAMGFLASGIGAAVGALTTMAIHAANAVEQLDNMAAQTGLAARDLEALQRIAEDMGLGTETLANSIGNLNRQLAIGEDTAFGSALRKLKISTTDMAGGAKDAITVLEELQGALKAIPDPAARSQAAAESLGKGMRELIPLILNTDKGIRELIGDMKESGRVMDDVTRQNFRDLDEGLDLISAGFQELSNTILSAVGSLFSFVTKWKQDIPPMKEDIGALTLAWAKWDEEMRRARGGAPIAFPPSPFRFKPPEELEAEAKAIASGKTGILLELSKKQELAEKELAQAIKDKNYVAAIGFAQQIAGYKQQADAIQKATQERTKALEQAAEQNYKNMTQIHAAVDEEQELFIEWSKDILKIRKETAEIQADIDKMGRKRTGAFGVEVTEETIAGGLKKNKEIADGILKDRREQLADEQEIWLKLNRQREEAFEKQQEQWERMLDTIREGAGRVFDAMLTKGQSVFASLANFAQGVLQTMLRNIFQNAVAGLMTAGSGGISRILGGGGAGGGANLQNMIGGGVSAAGGFSGISRLFGGGGGGGAQLQNRLNPGGQLGGFAGFAGSKLGAGLTAGGLFAGTALASDAFRRGSAFEGLAGGALAGASIGTMIAPGVGTAIGAGVGAIAGLITGLFGGGAKRRAEEAAKRAAMLEANQFAAPETITRYGTWGGPGEFAVEPDLTGQIRGIGRVPTVVVNVENNMIDARHAREAGEVIGQAVSQQILAGGSYLADNIAWAAGAP